ncbi:MAG TPA: ABC transporter ATP-binding protein [Pseudonocardiaceae bacterium]|nr:ABC transporter ATP-binding protein [Pseudonocardiaceae bacterium]
MTARHRSSNGDGAIDTLNPDELGSGAVGRNSSDDRELLVVEDLSVGFGTEDGIVHAVRNVSFTLGTRDVLGIVGESGSGKSVSSMAIMGLLPRTAKVTGSIKFHGRELVGLPYADLRKLRGNGISMIFQDPMTSLNPVFTVGWQLSEAYRAHHNVSKKAAWAKSVEALELVGIPQPDRRAAQYPHEFSGGMRQRAVIAMSIINDPELIIADEPTTALDVTVQAQILETLVRLKDETNAAVIMITHDLGVVAGMVDRVQVMYGGTVVESGAVEEVFAAPRMPYTIGLLGSIPNPAMVGRRLTPIKGAPPSLMNLPNGCPFTPRCPLAIDECRESEPALTETDRLDHRARCHRWSDLLTIESPQLLFEQQEIGMVENPAALTLANPDLPIMEDVVSIEQRIAAAAEDADGEHDTNEETTS